MPTPGEKKALLFLSLVAVLGAGTRLVAANRVPVPTEEEARALEGQLRAVDSVSRESKSKSRRRENRKAQAKRPAGLRPQPSTLDPQPAALDPPPATRHPRPVDVDRASVQELESLPGIGPALARRIVAARDSSGPFGSLEALQSRVRGVGPAMVKRLATAVTFSAPHSPPSAERTEPFGNGTTPAQRKRRRRH